MNTIFWRVAIIYAVLMAASVLAVMVWPVFWDGEIRQFDKPSHLSVRDWVVLSSWMAAVIAIGVRALIREIKDGVWP